MVHALQPFYDKRHYNTQVSQTYIFRFFLYNILNLLNQLEKTKRLCEREE